MQSWHLHIKGQVQGVGFRPFVYRLAVSRRLCGWVNNTRDGVHICFNGSAAEAEAFHAAILAELPAIAKVTASNLELLPTTHFSDFQIVHSSGGGPASLLLSPDFGICPNCRQEILAADNCRTDYAFSTCTYCGPRLSIIEGLPYDRPLTAMAHFEMCPSCQAEYEAPTDRRYYAQTNSCPDCAITLSLYRRNGDQLVGSQSELLDQVVDFWREGKIVALKGIGGYLLTCAADNSKVIRELRMRKHRPVKPLAVMFPTLETLSAATDTSPEVAQLLAGPVAPIAVLPTSVNESGLSLADLAPGLRKLGVMLPYTPLYTLLLARYGKPIVATSGNRSGQPIIYDEESALVELAPLADYILANNRPIVVPQDDSVVQWTPHQQQFIMLRRARGLAPTLLAPHSWQGGSVLATGADMKSSFALLHQGQTYLSPYLGDLTDWATQENYRSMLTHFQLVLQAEPQCVLVDAHPQYASTAIGKELADAQGLPLHRVPHHEAHLAAILGEHALTKTSEPVLGVIWDGTGWGSDGQIWGGELFDFQSGKISRIGQLDYFPNSLGDKLAREPRLCAWSLLAAAGRAPTPIQLQFTEAEYRFYEQHFSRPAKLKTSSMGRLFDGVAALLDLKAKQTHEAEAAMLLEAEARVWLEQAERHQLRDYLADEAAGQTNLATGVLVGAILKDIVDQKAVGAIAASFHYTLVQWVARVAQQGAYRRIAFSGGVFQNSLLVDLCQQLLSPQFKLYFHEQLPPNDENIAFGQLVWQDMQLQQQAATSRHEFASTTL